MEFSDFSSTFSGRSHGGHHYDPNQPRVPAGHRGAGQWTLGAGGASAEDERRWAEIFAQATAESSGSTEGGPDGDERPGALRRWMEIFRQAALERLGLAARERRGGKGGRASLWWIVGTAAEKLWRLIEEYRKENADPQLRLPFEDEKAQINTADPEQAVAVVWVDGQKKFGVSSKHRTYSKLIDGTRARRWLRKLLYKYPELRNIHSRQENKNSGWMPYDALSHAEATLLLRLAEENGDTL